MLIETIPMVIRLNMLMGVNKWSVIVWNEGAKAMGCDV